jgi:tetratricopeptide (TPR) repeat protein
MMGMVPSTPERFRGVEDETWKAALERGASVGLLTVLGLGMYRIHPALPPYLEGLWRAQAGDAYAGEAAAARAAATVACAALGGWAIGQMQGGPAEIALAVVRQLRRTFGRMALWGIEAGDFGSVEAILQPLFEMLEADGAAAELHAWADRCRVAVEGPLGEAPELGSAGGALWLFVVGNVASAWLRAGDTAQAEAAYREIEALLSGSRDPSTRKRLSIVYHQLGMVAQDRGELADAEGWYRKSLEIEEELGNRLGMAGSYHQLGMVAQDRGELADAQGWYRKSLEIDEELRNRPGLANGYHQLGMVAQERGELADAEEWYRKSLEIKEELGNRPEMAVTYAQFGLLDEARGCVDAALEWAVRSVALFPEFPSRATGTAPMQLARLTRVLELPALETTWVRIIGAPLRADVREGVLTLINQLERMEAGNAVDP